jgi:hypothetical protein
VARAAVVQAVRKEETAAAAESLAAEGVVEGAAMVEDAVDVVEKAD